jgi:SAM-dependent methyltransferase
MSKTVQHGDWYDYPQYYDLAFADDTPVEADFIDEVCRRFAVGPVRRLVEPGCGGGRLVVELARRGYRVVGLDLNRKSIEHLRRRIARGRLRAEAIVGDMTDFRLTKPADAAYNTFNTFRHLTSESAALKHLRAVAANLRPGGLYVLGFHLLPPDASDECIERWRAAKGKVRVSYTLRVVETDRREQYERLRVTMLVRRPQGELRLATEFDLRTYSARQIRRLFAQVPEFELCETYDFLYDPDQPVLLDDWLSDAVFVLRKR